MRWEHRPRNTCRTCGYNWFPRGHHLSIECPSCGSRDVYVSLLSFLGTPAGGFVSVATISVFLCVTCCIPWMICGGFIQTTKAILGIQKEEKQEEPAPQSTPRKRQRQPKY